jgi:hypothetical protein
VHCLLQEAQRCTTQATFQVWPPKSGSYLLIVLLVMGILVPETCWGNKTTYFIASSWFFTFTVSTMHGHRNITLTFSVSENTPTSMANCIQCLNQRYFRQNIRLVCSTCQICFWVLRKCDLILNLKVLCISNGSVNSLALLCTTGDVHYVNLFSFFFFFHKKLLWLKICSNVAEIEVFFAVILYHFVCESSVW